MFHTQRVEDGKCAPIRQKVSRSLAWSFRRPRQDHSENNGKVWFRTKRLVDARNPDFCEERIHTVGKARTVIVEHEAISRTRGIYDLLALGTGEHDCYPFTATKSATSREKSKQFRLATQDWFSEESAAGNSSSLATTAGIAAVETLVARACPDHDHPAIVAGRRVRLGIKGQQIRL